MSRLEPINPYHYARPGAPGNWRVEFMVRKGSAFARKVVEVQPGIGRADDRNHAISAALRNFNGHRMPQGHVVLVSAQRNREVTRKVIV